MERPVGINRGGLPWEPLKTPPFEVRLADALEGFTLRERDVLTLLVGGTVTNKALAEKLMISRRTIDTHIKKILGKMDVGNQAAIVATLYANQMVIVENSHLGPITTT